MGDRPYAELEAALKEGWECAWIVDQEDAERLAPKLDLRHAFLFMPPDVRLAVFIRKRPGGSVYASIPVTTTLLDEAVPGPLVSHLRGLAEETVRRYCG